MADDKSVSDELAPCPFCGDEAQLRCSVRDDDSAAPRPHRHYIVECGLCSATIDVESPRWWSSSATPREDADDLATRAEAIAAWNRRSPPSGYRLVPVEPTTEMVIEGLVAFVGSVKSTWGDPSAQEKGSVAHSMAIGQTLHSGAEVQAAYRAMLEAAPSPKEGK